MLERRERSVNVGVSRIFNTSIHTFVHTTFTGSAWRPQTRHGRAGLAPEISGAAGRVRIRPRGRTRRCEACTLSGTASDKSLNLENGESRDGRTRLTSGQKCPLARRGGRGDCTGGVGRGAEHRPWVPDCLNRKWSNLEAGGLCRGPSKLL